MQSVVPPGVSRRGFLVGGAAAAATLAAGCGSGSGDVDTFTAAFQGSGASESIDPGVGSLFIDEARYKALYDGLFEVDGAMRAIPRLATAAEPNADGTRWRITVRDAQWHDGKKLTSRDVLYTLGRILGPPQEQPFIAAATLDQVDLSQSRVVDDSTAEIVLRSPNFEVPLALAAYGAKIVQDGATDMSHPVGTGPFVFESFEAGKELSATVNDRYWDGAPTVRRLRIVSAEADARLSAVQSGQVDFADNITPSAVRTLRGRHGISLDSAPNSGIYFFAMKTDRPPFDNPDVRRAVMRMVDRDELVKVALAGEGQIANDVFGKGYQYYADFPQHEYDPDEVGRLLRRAGVRDLSFDLFTAPVDFGFVEAARLFADQAARCGVRVNVVVGSKDSYYSDALKSGALTMGQSGPLAIPNHFASRLLTGSPQNRTKWSDPEFDRLFARAQATSAEEGRTAIYRTMHEILYDRGGFVFFGDANWNTAARDDFGNAPTGAPNSHGWARFDRVTAQ